MSENEGQQPQGAHCMWVALKITVSEFVLLLNKDYLQSRKSFSIEIVAIVYSIVISD